MQVELHKCRSPNPYLGLPKISAMILGMAHRKSRWSDDQLRHLANAVAARRKHLGFTQERVHDNGGPVAGTIIEIERGESAAQFKTLGKLDVGLNWPRETALEVLAGNISVHTAATLDSSVNTPGPRTPHQANLQSPTPDQIAAALAVLVSAGFAELQRRAQGALSDLSDESTPVDVDESD